jgi:hypothetical protein
MDVLVRELLTQNFDGLLRFRPAKGSKTTAGTNGLHMLYSPETVFLLLVLQNVAVKNAPLFT